MRQAIKASLLVLLLWGHAIGADWAKWNGVTVGSSSTNISNLNAFTIGTSTGNYGAWNGLISPGGGPSGCASFNYSANITIDHTKVPSDQTGFATLILGTYDGTAGEPDLRDTGSGGHIENASGYDLYAYSDTSCTTRIPAERVFYDASTGSIELWVKQDLSASVDSNITIGFGDASIMSDPNSDGTYGKTAVWDSNFKLVSHLPDGSTLGLTDSTSNANNGTNHSATATTGQIDGGAAFGGSGTISVAHASSLSITGNITVSAWVKSNTSQSSKPLLAKWNANPGYLLFVSSNANKVLFDISVSGSQKLAESSATYNDNAWHLFHGVFNGSNVLLYVDGALVTTGDATAGPIDSNTEDVVLGNFAPAAGSFIGSQDEVRISNIARSANWIAASYNNQSSPSTFYAMGMEIPHGGGGGTPAYISSDGCDLLGITNTCTVVSVSIPSGSIIVCGESMAGGNATGTCSDSNTDSPTCSATYTQTDNGNTIKGCVMVAGALVTTVTCTTEFTNTGDCLVSWYSPGSLSGTLDKEAGQNQPNTDVWTSGSTATLSSADELVVDLWSTLSTSITNTPSDGSTQRFAASTNTSAAISDRVVSATTAVAATGTWSTTTYGVGMVMTIQ